MYSQELDCWMPSSSHGHLPVHDLQVIIHLCYSLLQLHHLVVQVECIHISTEHRVQRVLKLQTVIHVYEQLGLKLKGFDFSLIWPLGQPRIRVSITWYWVNLSKRREGRCNMCILQGERHH